MPGRVIATRRLVKTVTVAPNTASSAATSTSWALGAVILAELDIVIPDGHSGLTGIAVEYDGVRILPWGGASDWIIGNGETVPTPVDFEVGHPLTVRAYNTDATYPHTFRLRALVTDLGLPGPAVSLPAVVAIA